MLRGEPCAKLACFRQPCGILSAMRILVVEDDAVLAEATSVGLARAGFSVDRAPDGEQAQRWLAAEHFDLVLIDIGLPGIDGLTLLQQLRRSGNAVPVLMLTARDALADRVGAFDRGADDYVIKPFDLPELVVRCRALIRRAHGANNDQIALGALQLDVAGHRALVKGVEVRLAKREWAVLECLALNVGRVVSKERLQQAVCSYDDELSLQAIEVYVSRLRTKLADAVRITLARGLGYRLDELIS